MIVWFACLLPVATVMVLLWRFAHEIHVVELACLLGVPMILVCAGKHLADWAGTADTEFLSDTVTKAEYLEDWNQTVPCRHPKYRTVRDGKHTRQVYAGQQHAFDVDYHPPEWWLHTTQGWRLRTSSDYFETLAARFQNRVFVDLRRRHFTNDGDQYLATWSGAEPTRTPVVQSHGYENRVQAAGSVFAYAPIDSRQVPVFDYPPITTQARQAAILGGSDIPGRGAANERLEQWNARLGPQPQAKILVCCFRDQPLQRGLDQEAFWKGGNKNEFVVCLGLDATRQVQWAHVFSWTKSEALKVAARNQVLGTSAPLDLPAYVEWLGAAVQTQYVRREFADFNYLTVDPPTWAVVLIYVLTAAVCAAIGFWAVCNDVRPTHGDPMTDAWKEAQTWVKAP